MPNGCFATSLCRYLDVISRALPGASTRVWIDATMPSDRSRSLQSRPDASLSLTWPVTGGYRAGVVLQIDPFRGDTSNVRKT